MLARRRGKAARQCIADETHTRDIVLNQSQSRAAGGSDQRLNQ